MEDGLCLPLEIGGHLVGVEDEVLVLVVGEDEVVDALCARLSEELASENVEPLQLLRGSVSRSEEAKEDRVLLMQRSEGGDAELLFSTNCPFSSIPSGEEDFCCFSSGEKDFQLLVILLEVLDWLSFFTTISFSSTCFSLSSEVTPLLSSSSISSSHLRLSLFLVLSI